MGNIDITQKLSLSDALSVGLQTTITGISIVFLVLIILMLVLMAMKYIFAGKTEKKEKTAKTTGKEKLDDDVIAVITAAVRAVDDEEELVAVLTAAVAASLNTSTYNLKIKSYRRIGNNAPAWNKAGLTDVIGSRY